MLKLSNQISWECAIKYFTGDLDLGILGFDHANGRVVPRRSVGVPDCVAYLLSKGPKFIIGRRSVPHLRELIDALDSFKRQILCCKFFEGQLHGDGSSTSSTLQWSGLMLPSTWQPPSHPEIVHLLDKMRLDMMANFAATAAQFHTFSNLDAIDRMGLRWLKDNDFVVVKDDKGSSLIPQRRTFKESVRIALATDIDQFEASKPDACAVHLAVENIVPKLGLPGRVAGLLTWQKAFEEWPIHDIEYTWKSHKQVQTARCITPTTRSPLTPLAKVVQRRLKPVVANKAQIVTCTRDVVAALDGLPVPSDVWLGTGDIKDFYPSTCPTQACEVIRNELLDFEGPSQRAAINALVAAMSLVLSNQYVRANGQIFRCRRIGQGLACASEICDLVALLISILKSLPCCRNARNGMGDFAMTALLSGLVLLTDGLLLKKPTTRQTPDMSASGNGRKAVCLSWIRALQYMTANCESGLISKLAICLDTSLRGPRMHQPCLAVGFKVRCKDTSLPTALLRIFVRFAQPFWKDFVLAAISVVS